MMHMGNMTKDFVPVGKEEQAEVKDETNSNKVAELLGIDGILVAFFFTSIQLIIMIMIMIMIF